MNSQHLLYVNIFLGLAFVAYFILGRAKPRAPVKLNVKVNEDFKKSIIANDSLVPATEDLYVASAVQKQKMTILEPENVIDLNAARAQAAATKTLNIYFMYNGHEWESHEVLGVPAGAKLPVVTEVYQKLIKTSDSSTFEFYESAYQAILRRWKDRL